MGLRSEMSVAVTIVLVVALIELVDLGPQSDDGRRHPQALMILLDNIAAIEEHNKQFDQGEVTFRMRLNKFAHLATERFRRIVNGFRRPGQHGPISERFRNFIRRVLAFRSPINAQVLGVVDWRNLGVDLEVLDQKNCASCWAFSTVGAVEGQVFRKTGLQVHLSQQELVDCATMHYGSYGCNGGSIDGAYLYIEDKGITGAQNYPYEAVMGTCKYQTSRDAVYLSGFIRIEQGNETQLQEAVATVGPVAVAMDASQRTFQFYSQGIYYDPNCSSTDLDHAVLVVGYGTTPGGLDYWVVKNSYGSDWGEGGYFRLARNKGNHCGIATHASYPILA